MKIPFYRQIDFYCHALRIHYIWEKNFLHAVKSNTRDIHSSVVINRSRITCLGYGWCFSIFPWRWDQTFHLYFDLISSKILDNFFDEFLATHHEMLFKREAIPCSTRLKFFPTSLSLKTIGISVGLSGRIKSTSLAIAPLNHQMFTQFNSESIGYNVVSVTSRFAYTFQ